MVHFLFLHCIFDFFFFCIFDDANLMKLLDITDVNFVLANFSLNNLALKQSSEKYIGIGQCNHHMLLRGFPLPRACCVLTFNSQHAHVKVLKLWSCSGAPEFCSFLLTAPPPLFYAFQITINLLLHVSADTSSPLNFTLTHFSHPTPHHCLPLDQILHSGLCGVSGSGCCWLVAGLVEMSRADEVGAGESYQTLGAALVQAKQSDRSILVKWALHSLSITDLKRS